MNADDLWGFSVLMPELNMTEDYAPDQPRDDSGRWTSSGGSWSYTGIKESVSKLEKEFESLKKQNKSKTFSAGNNRAGKLYSAIKKQEENISKMIEEEMNGKTDVPGDIKALMSARRRIRQLQKNLLEAELM